MTKAGTRMIGMGVLLALFIGPPARAESKTVTLSGTEFMPPRVEILVGDTVVWKNEGGEHTVTARNGEFDSRRQCLLGLNCRLQVGDQFTHEFTKAGTFAYFCEIHEKEGMTGEVVVAPKPAEGGGGGGAPSTTATTQPPSSTTTVTTKPKPASTTTTTRPLTTSSTVVRSTTTLADTTTTLTPNEPPAFDPGSDDGGGEASGSDTGASGAAGGVTDGNKGGDDTGAVAVIVALLLAVSAGGGYLLWRLRPHRGV